MPESSSPAMSACGSWASPISSELITAGSVGLEQLRLHRNAVFWIERRPEEAGRCVIVMHQDNVTRDVLPAPYSARSRVHEYGGGAYCITADITENRLFFVNDEDQNIYSLVPGSPPRQITRYSNRRFADMVHDARRNRLICVCEDHGVSQAQPLNSLVAVDLSSAAVTSLHHGYDFYSNPRLDHVGEQLAWLCWNHPDMPWDATELWRASLHADGAIGDAALVTGGDGVSVCQPEWSPQGALCFASDATGWWNIYRCTDAGTEQLTHERAEFGQPQWVFGQSSYAFCAEDRLVCSYLEAGESRLALLDPGKRQLEPIDIGMASVAYVRASDGWVCFIAASRCSYPAITQLDLASGQLRSIRSSSTIEVDSAYLSPGQTISFKTRHDDRAFAIYYPPANRDFVPLPGEKPPLIVICHGGPTACTDAALDLRKQYWTSRGFALIDVNYSGSTGFGREYRERLNGRWGVRDVEDCCDAALYLAAQGLADVNRMIIRGSSAGGYTVLAALTFHDTFAAGASYYGISELESLAKDTHKFESRYLDKLVGPYPGARQIYRDRSPVYHADRLNCPVIFFQGLEDRVVPPGQAEKMVAALDAKGIAVAYLAFEHEQHGFRNAATIRATLNAELFFYSALFSFQPPGEPYPIEIRNLDHRLS